MEIEKEKKFISISGSLKKWDAKKFNIHLCRCGGKFVPTKTSRDMCIPCKFRNKNR